ncbi:MAG: hypothetical protein UH241_03510, partial [Acutalibacteraceae bacterium]|nr:hypothetical protein [Acutalibacteraceae bacterium]
MNTKTKMSKRILSTILSFLILLSIMPIIPITASATDDYLIYTANDLMNFAKQVNSGSKSTNGKLMANINMAGKVWEPILDYAGTFNGQGYSISNLTMTIKGEGCFGMFGKVNGATIKDFSLTGSVTSNRTANSNFNYGSIIGWSDGNTSLLRVHSAVNFTSYDNTYKDKVGGLIGHVQSSILNVDCCSYSGTLNVGASDVDCMGGIVAYVNANKAAVITHCKFTGKIQSTYTGTNADDNSFVGDQIGGFVGYYRGVNLYIQSCLSVGTISVASGYSALSGHFMGILRQHNSANSKINNNYYLTGNPFGNNPNITDEITDGMGGQTVAGSATKTTSAQLKSGEIAYKLGSAWGQKIGTDSSPVIGGNKVYYGYTSCSDNATKVYTNTSTTSTKPAHSWLNGICSGCKKSCQHSWSKGTCSICKKVCEHNWDNGTCSVCKEACDHNWENSICTVCEKNCQHSWSNSTCTICEQVCQHNWSNGVCSVCKKVCDHNWKNSICT